MITLTCLVLLVGGSSQALASAFAANTEQLASAAQATVAPFSSQESTTPTSCTLVVRSAHTGIVLHTYGGSHTFRLSCAPIRPIRPIRS